VDDGREGARTSPDSAPVDLAGFVHSRGRSLIRFAHAVCGDRALAEDLVQEAMAKLVRRFGERIDVEHPEAYVRRVIVREFLQWRRRRTVSEVPGLLSDTPDVAGGPEPDQREVMWRFLAGLPRRQRAVLVLGYYEDLSDAEIADLMGCSASTVRSQRARALAKLKADPDLAKVASATGVEGRR
jgi:RNA polymerase sigma-70 factor (sigma-E family)